MDDQPLVVLVLLPAPFWSFSLLKNPVATRKPGWVPGSSSAPVAQLSLVLSAALEQTSSCCLLGKQLRGEGSAACGCPVVVNLLTGLSCKEALEPKQCL